MDGVASVILLALTVAVAEIVIERSSVHVRQKRVSSKKRAVDSESINFLIKYFIGCV